MSIPHSGVPPSAQEIQSRLEVLNRAYSTLMASKNPSDDKREAFRQARLWFEDRRIALRHIERDSPWLLG